MPTVLGSPVAWQPLSSFTRNLVATRIWGAEYMQTRKRTHASFCAAPTTSRQRTLGKASVGLSLQGALPPTRTRRAALSQLPVLSFRSTPGFWLRAHSPLSCLTPCPAGNNVLLPMRMSCSPVSSLPRTLDWPLSCPFTSGPPLFSSLRVLQKL